MLYNLFLFPSLGLFFFSSCCLFICYFKYSHFVLARTELQLVQNSQYNPGTSNSWKPSSLPSIGITSIRHHILAVWYIISVIISLNKNNKHIIFQNGLPKRKHQLKALADLILLSAFSFGYFKNHRGFITQILCISHDFIFREIPPIFQRFFLDTVYLKAQNFSSFGERVLCLLDQVFPRLFPIHTS